MTMRMSADGRARLMRREGVETKAYRDTKGILTIGVGHTAAAGEPRPLPGMEITLEQAEHILMLDLRPVQDVINDIVTVPLTQGQFDALASLTFNIGLGGFKKSTIVRRLNAGDYRGAADAFMMWNKPPEIRGRRESERQQFIAATPKPIAAARAEASDVDEAIPITARDLREAGSRTVRGADQVQSGLGGLVTAAGGAAAVGSQISDVAGQVQSAADSVSSASGALAWASSHWQLLALGALLAAVLYCAWRIHCGARLALLARVDDANSGLHVGR